MHDAGCATSALAQSRVSRVCAFVQRRCTLFIPLSCLVRFPFLLRSHISFVFPLLRVSSLRFPSSTSLCFDSRSRFLRLPHLLRLPPFLNHRACMRARHRARLGSFASSRAALPSHLPPFSFLSRSFSVGSLLPFHSLPLSFSSSLDSLFRLRCFSCRVQTWRGRWGVIGGEFASDWMVERVRGVVDDVDDVLACSVVKTHWRRTKAPLCYLELHRRWRRRRGAGVCVN